MFVRVLLCVMTLGVSTAAAQTVDGEIAGRIRDKSGAPLPGVRISATAGTQSREAVTDSDGRFAFRSLPVTAYRVAASLPGFISISGEVRLSPSSPRAFLAWPLEVGCLEIEDVVKFGPREMAPRADAILHARVVSVDGPVLMSARPECRGLPRHQYSIQVLANAPAHRRTVPAQGPIFTRKQGALLKPGLEYVAFLSSDDLATADLVLPVVSGLIASPEAGELNGMPVAQGLKLLGEWAQARKP